MKVREVIRLLEDGGWYLARTKGSHRQFKHRTKRGTVTVSGQSGIDVPPRDSEQYSQTGWLEIGANMKYAVVVEQGETSFGAHVPDLPGCVAVAETRDEVLKLIQEAIQFHIEGLREDGLTVPPPSSSVEFVEVRAA